VDGLGWDEGKSGYDGIDLVRVYGGNEEMDRD
jgi:hypothetical protein